MIGKVYWSKVLLLILLITTTTPCFAHPHQTPIAHTLVSCVQVKNPRGGIGAGVIIAPGNRIITANHVIATDQEDSGKIVQYRIVFDDGQEALAVVVKQDEARDLALLQFVDEHLFKSAVELGQPLTRDNRGDAVFVIGSPFLQINSVKVGSVSNVSQNELILDLETIPGMSGGGVFNDAGQLVGIITNFRCISRIMPFDNQMTIYSAHEGVAVPLSIVKKFLGH